MLTQSQNQLTLKTTVALIASTITLGFSSSVLAQSDQLSTQLINSANQLNQQLPKMIDPDTRLDSTQGGPGRQLSYNLTLVNYSSNQINNQKFYQNVSPLVRKEACTHQGTQVLFNNKILIRFNYYGNDGRLISTIEVNSSDCGF
ncbi:hypothetical protein [Gloeothece verrucosa]|uniref:Uncharacterized protein n=1 Tax=Gloeothece verrucosa (strain PCC 7822) TaxID=497965 RepID=E0UE10_GLOV7|nr:hypothetical protein [Gloeothece verrucosa]ADN13014.1 hypothetical protein Cyan7822_1004 [Gloeothece verrucosa PCC 7822]